MRTRLIAAAVVVAAVGAGPCEGGRLLSGGRLDAAARAEAATRVCLAALVEKRRVPGESQRADVVSAGPFTGIVWRRYDVVRGRFRLHVGDWRDRRIGLTQKIGWFLPRRYPVSGTLVVRGRRDSSARSFRQEFQRAGNTNTPGYNMFPTDIHPPAAGCWRLSFRSGRVTGSVTVLVRS